MLSLTDVPKNLHENLAWRRDILTRAEDNPSLQVELVASCKKDILFYINSFCFTYDPRTKAKSLPFITYPYQDYALTTILSCIENGRDLVIEKSRDMGASWMSLAVMEWLWHFYAGHSFLMVSRKEELVDKPGNSDSLFWKVDFIHRYLPRWLLPVIDRRKLHFGNDDSGSTIDGESTTAAAGVGGRRTAMFIDEFSRIEEGYQLLAGTADTTRCRIFNFTPFGTSNAAYKLARRGDVKKLRLHWSEHPEKARGLYRFNEQSKQVENLKKTWPEEFERLWKESAGPDAGDFRFIMDGKLRSPWYDAECRRRANEREVAQMLDIDYAGSAYQFFDKATILDLQLSYGCPPHWEGDIEFDPDSGQPRNLISVKGGPLKLWCPLDGNNRPPRATYGAGADIATGTGATNSCCSITDSRTGEKAAEYTNPFLRPEQFAVRVVALCRWFKSEEGEVTMLAWEQQGPGTVFGKRVVELGYRRIYFRTGEHSLAKPISDVPGWYPSNDSKRILLEEYRSALASRQFLNRSVEALEECNFFEHTDRGTVEHTGGDDLYLRDPETGKRDPSGAGVNHGDRVIADALSWKMCRQISNPRRKEKEKETPVGSLAWRIKLSDDSLRKAML